MANPQFLEEEPLSLVEVKSALAKIEQRDQNLNFLSTRLKEYVENFIKLPVSRKEQLRQKLIGLELTRIKAEHVTKIIDFLPITANELKIVLQAYPLSLPKKDQESIINAINEFLK